MGTAPVQQVNDALVHRYAEASDCDALVLDIDATLIASDKGDATYNYKKIKSYHPMLGFLSDGTDDPLCSFVQFRQGNASATTDILEALQHTVAVLPESGNLRYVRSDSAGYQHTLLEYGQDQGLWYTITAVQDASVHQAIRDILATDWRRLHDQGSGFKTSREVAETVQTLADSRHSFRLVVVRELADTPDLFGPYTYWVIATNIPADGSHAKTSEEIVWHHQGRGNCERYIEDTKYGVMLRYVPCGQFDANAMYYAIGLLAYNLLKLLQMLVVPASWAHRTVRSLRRGLFRFVGKVIYRSRQWTLQIAQPKEVIRQLRRIREKIVALAAPG